MAHYAKINDENKVENVIVAEQDFIDTLEGRYIQTSYNTHAGVHYQPDTDIPSEDQSKALRKNFACVDMIYDEERDAFYTVRPFDSYVLNEDTCVWQPPLPKPDNVKKWGWNEEVYQAALRDSTDTSLAWEEITD